MPPDTVNALFADFHAGRSQFDESLEELSDH